jgi:4-amino-4-deoxy-L-arabinose transferase-like glycosyltransferase
MGFLNTLLSPFTSLLALFNPQQQQQQQQTATFAYQQSGPGSPYDWQAAAPQWKAIGITLLALLALGVWDKTRPLAIWIAVGLAILLLLGKVQQNAA